MSDPTTIQIGLDICHRIHQSLIDSRENVTELTNEHIENKGITTKKSEYIACMYEKELREINSLLGYLSAFVQPERQDQGSNPDAVTPWESFADDCPWGVTDARVGPCCSGNIDDCGNYGPCHEGNCAPYYFAKSIPARND